MTTAADADGKTKGGHLLRPEASTALRASLPKYDPTKAAPRPLRARDVPHAVPNQGSAGGVVVLPDYVVRGDKVPVSGAYDLLTPKGRLELAYQLNPGLKVGPLHHLNDDHARDLLEEERRVQRMEEGAELINLSAMKDPSHGKELKRLWYDTYVRSRGWK